MQIIGIGGHGVRVVEEATAHSKDFRRLIITEAGYFEAGAAETASGDVIVIIILLRTENGGFRLIGSANIDRISNVRRSCQGDEEQRGKWRRLSNDVIIE